MNQKNNYKILMLFKNAGAVRRFCNTNTIRSHEISKPYL